MRSFIEFARVVTLCVCALQTAAFAQPSSFPQDMPSPRERWEKLSPAERERMRERFEALQRMSPEERQGVVERFERVRALEHGARERLSSERGRELSALDEPARREALRGMVERELSERGRAMRELLPPDLREKLERAAPQERERLLGKFREQVRRDRFEHVLRDLGRRLDLRRDELERVRALPEVERERELLGLERRAIELELEGRGLPPWLERAEWDAWRALDTPQFIERWHARAREVGFKRSLAGAGSAEDPRQRPSGPPPRRFDPERLHEAFERLHPDPRWFSELSQLDAKTRRETIETRMRARALEFFERAPDLIAPRELEQLKQLQGHEFFERLRRHLHELAPPRPFTPGEGPRGPRPPDLIPKPEPPRQKPPQQNGERGRL